MYKDVKPSWKKSEFPRGNFFYHKFDPWLLLFLWHCLHYIIDSFSPCRHQNVINFEFLHKQVSIFVAVLIMHKYGNCFSFYGNKIWLRAGKGIFAVFQSVVCCAFTYRCLSPYVIVAYIKYYFSDNFSHRLLKPIFFFLVMNQEILLTLNSSWNILVLLGCMQVLDTSAASRYSFLCLLFASLLVLKLEGQREKQCKKILVKIPA